MSHDKNRDQSNCLLVCVVRSQGSIGWSIVSLLTTHCVNQRRFSQSLPGRAMLEGLGSLLQVNHEGNFPFFSALLRGKSLRMHASAKCTTWFPSP